MSHNLGPIVSNKGLRVAQEDYLQAIEERHVKHSTALQSIIKGRGAYHVGPLARLNLNAERLHPRAAELLPRVCQAVGKPLPWRNASQVPASEPPTLATAIAAASGAST